MADELERNHPPVAPTPGCGQTPPPLAGHSPGFVWPTARFTRWNRWSCTACKKNSTRSRHPFYRNRSRRPCLLRISPLLAARDRCVEAARYQSEVDSWPDNEWLATEFSRRSYHDLVPDWANCGPR